MVCVWVCGVEEWEKESCIELEDRCVEHMTQRGSEVMKSTVLVDSEEQVWSNVKKCPLSEKTMNKCEQATREGRPTVSGEMSHQLLTHGGEAHARRVCILVAGVLGEFAVVELVANVSFA